MLDLDGTVYRGNTLIEGSVEAIENMRSHGIKVFFCTNNSSKMPENISKKLNNLGIKCDNNDILSSGHMAIRYVKENQLKNVYISGTKELKIGFLDAGIKTCGANESETMVIAMDPNFDYVKLTEGVRAAINAKTIIVCNEDRCFEKEDGIYPGNGAMTSSILYCSNRKPNVVIGKPNSIMLDYVMRQYGYSKEEIIVIGDSIDSDGQMANKIGCNFILVGKRGDYYHEIVSLKDTIEWNWSSL